MNLTLISSVSALALLTLTSLILSRIPGVIEYLEKGRVPADHADFRELVYKKALTKMLSHSTDEKHYTHGFNVSWCLL